MNLNEEKDVLANLLKERSDLIRKYSGVRPSWVSTDVALLGERIERLRAEIIAAEAE